ncbi:tetratricopeptide repeat protein [Bacillus benzoevorans]|uniref:Tetratricopeptide (TPR) repeat protein n=1 Tax=Bacillus benzoevorans TaxID=1456 RepID=A0A7X0LW03_9BACI|nr:tetratricopeptide repeat protein [Bacillus benzoevorans]MBB6445092.1 tetratricopeptide (TPR) repeat protein [Bacillus benzoevorans]
MSKNSHVTQPTGKVLSFIPTGEYYFTKGLKAFRRRDFHKAKKYLQRALQLEPHEPMIACQLAIIYTELGEYQQSNQLLHMVMEEMDHDMVECHYFLANNYAHLGFFKDAYHHANCYLEMESDGEFVEDAEDLIEVLTLEADEIDDEDLYGQDDLMMKQEQARELLESGHFPKAIKILNEVIKEFPEHWSAYNNLALAYFYLGEFEKALQILDDVMERNPGNLHAVCNKLVFSYFLKDFKQVMEIKSMLKKVQPILTDHQYKIGATFALVGEYEPAYQLLRKLQKHGYEGDGPFYYWLAYSSYFTGKEQLARTVWEKVLEINPEKAGFEPWSENHPTAAGYEESVTTILKKLDSNHMEERLFAVFLISLSTDQGSDLFVKEHLKFEQFSVLEKQYVSMIRSGIQPESSQIPAAHEVALMLYEQHQPIGTVEAGLYLMWFTAFISMFKEKVSLKNKKAYAAAIEYIWNKLRSEKVSQQQVANHYGLSLSTLQKYVKLVNHHLQ